MWRSMIYGVLMWTITVYAFRRGGWEEKLASAAFVINSYLTLLLLSSEETAYHGLESAVLNIDLGFFLLLILIVLLSRKFWPMWVAAMAAMSVMAHLLPFMPGLNPYLYFRAEALWSWPMWIVLGFAAHRHHRARLSTS